jgi:hypothetical protein
MGDIPMKNKYITFFEKYFHIIIIVLFLTITSLGVMSLKPIEDSYPALKIALEMIFKLFHIIKDYNYIFYTLILTISSIYIYLKGDKRNKIFTTIILITSLITFIYSITTKHLFFIEHEIRHAVAFPLFFIFINVFEIFYKTKEKQFIENLFFKTIKITTIYIAAMFLLGKITGLYFIPYAQFPYGYTGRFREPNALSHVYATILPILMYFFHKRKNYKTIFYILISIVCALLIGTKAAYIGVYASLITFLLVSAYKYIRTKKINIKKVLIIGSILIFLISINKHLYTPQLVKQNIDDYTIIEVIDIENGKIEKEEIDKVNFVLKGRQKVVEEMWWVYKTLPIKNKLIGIGYYYPKYMYVLTEMDACDVLFKQGIIGILICIYTTIYYIIKILKNIKNNIKRINIEELVFPLASIGMVTLASIIAGHVMYNYITIFFYSLTIVFLYTKAKETK